MTNPVPRETSERNSSPLVSIGMPTYNRAAGLEQAVTSALSQDYVNFEITISDNASSDETASLVRELWGADARVRYMRQPQAIPPAANFESARAGSRGKYFMWLADDDWLSPNFLRVCVEAMEADPRLMLAGGEVRYYRNKMFLFDATPTRLTNPLPGRRVLDYYRQVGDNGVFYGLMRLHPTRGIQLPGAIGGDWYFVAALAFMGHVTSLSGITLHRDFTWDERSLDKLAAASQLVGLERELPYLAIANGAFRRIWSEQSVYRQLSPVARVWLAIRVWRLLTRRHRLGLPRLVRKWVRFKTGGATR